MNTWKMLMFVMALVGLVIYIEVRISSLESDVSSLERDVSSFARDVRQNRFDVEDVKRMKREMGLK
tara:strand:- start:178 stop:375 length:198 start_codon:yes stop_codon:yes gene_type:complete